MRQILRFHRQLYIATAAGIIAALALSMRVKWLAIAAVPAAFWFVSSLVVSWYVYDRSSIFLCNWLPARLGRTPATWINLHAGLDHASAALRHLFPLANGQSFDIFDPHEMRAASIREARHVVRAPEPNRVDWWSAIPPQDAVFLIFTAHELRRPEARVYLFRKVADLLAAGGQVAVVEHVRDWRNFIAFGPGFWHFLPLRAWHATAAAAGLRVSEKFQVTPFVRVFLMERAI